MKKVIWALLGLIAIVLALSVIGAKSPDKQTSTTSGGNTSQTPAPKLSGRVLPFSNVSFGAINATRTAFGIEVTVSPDSVRSDWGATAAGIADYILRKSNLAYIKVEVLRDDVEHVQPIRLHSTLATVYYGPNPATSPWPKEPFSLLLSDRMLSQNEIRAQADFDRLGERYTKKYGDEKGEGLLESELARKYTLPQDWFLKSTRGVEPIAPLSAVNIQINEGTTRRLNNLAACVDKFRSQGGALGQSFDCPEGGVAEISTDTSPVIDPQIPLKVRTFFMLSARIVALAERCKTWKANYDLIKNAANDAGISDADIGPGGRYSTPMATVLKDMRKGTATESAEEACKEARKNYGEAPSK
jgi:hypothetical protein